jgi:hypothetical protein
MANVPVRAPAPVWDVPLPPIKPRSYDQKYVVDQAGEDVLIVSSRVETLRTHFWRGRTRPCTEGEETCWLDHRETGRPRYAGWIAVVEPARRKKIWLLRLTEHALRSEAALLSRSGQLRGRLLRVWRDGPTEWSEMYAELDQASPVGDLPPEPDVRTIVWHMIEADDRKDRELRAKVGPFRRALEAQQRRTIEAAKAKGVPDAH